MKIQADYEFSITKIIKQASSDRAFLNTIFENLDVDERNSKTVHFHVSNTKKYIAPVQHTTSIATNIIEHVDFEIYKPYVTLDWYQAKDDDNIVNAALRTKNFGLVKHLLSLSLPDEKETLSLKEAIAVRTVEFIWNSFEYYKYKPQDSKEFIEVWQSALNILLEFQESYGFGQYSDNPSILEKIEGVRYSRTKLNPLSFACSISAEKALFPLFELMMQSPRQELEKVFISSEDENALNSAIWAGNIKVANIILKEKLFSQEQLKSIIVSHGSDLLYSHEILNELKDIALTKPIYDLMSYLTTQTQQEMKAHEIMPYFHLSENHKGFKEKPNLWSKEKFIQNFPQLLSQNLTDESHTSAKEVLILEEVLKHWQDSLGLELKVKANPVWLNQYQMALKTAKDLNIELTPEERNKNLFKLANHLNSGSHVSDGIFDNIYKEVEALLNNKNTEIVIEKTIMELALTNEKASKVKVKI